MKNITRQILIVVICCIIVAAAGEPVYGSAETAFTNPAATTRQDEAPKQDKIPVVARPVMILPGNVPQIPQDILEVSKPGSIQYVLLDLEPLKDTSEKSRLIKFWLGGDIGYIILKRQSLTRNNYMNTTSWGGDLQKQKAAIALTFTDKGKLVGGLSFNNRIFEIFPLRGTKYYIIYEADPEALKKFNFRGDSYKIKAKQRLLKKKQEENKKKLKRKDNSNNFNKLIQDLTPSHAESTISHPLMIAV